MTSEQEHSVLGVIADFRESNEKLKALVKEQQDDIFLRGKDLARLAKDCRDLRKELEIYQNKKPINEKTQEQSTVREEIEKWVAKGRNRSLCVFSETGATSGTTVTFKIEDKDRGEYTYHILNPGDEALDTLTKFCRRHP